MLLVSAYLLRSSFLRFDFDFRDRPFHAKLFLFKTFGCLSSHAFRLEIYLINIIKQITKREFPLERTFDLPIFRFYWTFHLSPQETHAYMYFFRTFLGFEKILLFNIHTHSTNLQITVVRKIDHTHRRGRLLGLSFCLANRSALRELQTTMAQLVRGATFEKWIELERRELLLVVRNQSNALRLCGMCAGNKNDLHS